MPVPVLTISEMRAWETATWATGQTEAEVIRRVGKAVARCALARTRSGDRILVLCGRGNNGADARAALDHLTDRQVEALDVRDPEAALQQLESALSLQPVLVIDGLFGIGINRPLDAAWQRFIERVNAARRPVLSVDVPSGLNADSGEVMGDAIRATITLTVGAPKVGLLKSRAWPYVGRLEVADDVGLIRPVMRTELNWTMPEDFAGYPPARAVHAHKGSCGHVAVLAGSPGYHGAAVLASRGAQRARPGLITLITDERVYVPCAAQLQAVMVQVFTRSDAFKSNVTSILAGPGLAAPGLDPVRELVSRLWMEATVPVVVDASALAWLSGGSIPMPATRVITPHPGEAARMLETTTEQVQSDRVSALRELSRRFGNCWVVLKGQQTLVGRSSGEVYVNSSGNPSLAQGGSGDVLAGYLAGLLAQPDLQNDPLTALRFGVWQHGATADALEADRSNWVVEDLVERIGACGAGQS
ncbi:MAG TPA: NAD(P)H-hydrate dehydratase [Verrucomicrobia bacterium]|nr:NAD(P)H-hydrate dehydratase [Verrucomicrobiota bacterium]HOP98472.1 NAD(P)H-hydrate dehydratase [Verrucomicrobiota bacterium]